MIKRKYSQEYKLAVIREYIQSPHGMRAVARSLGLPSQNYIINWLNELLALGLVSEQELIAAGKVRGKGTGYLSRKMQDTVVSNRTL